MNNVQTNSGEMPNGLRDAAAASVSDRLDTVEHISAMSQDPGQASTSSSGLGKVE